jgi:hypothetical protein
MKNGWTMGHSIEFFDSEDRAKDRIKETKE